MKYLLFGGEVYYPEGGSGDLLGIFDEVEQAKEHFAKNPQEWGEIVLLRDGDHINAGYLEVKLIIGQHRSVDESPYTLTDWSPPPPREINTWLSESLEH